MSRRTAWRLALWLLLGALVAWPFAQRGYEIWRMRAEIARIERQKASVLQEIERLKAQLALKDDLDYIEYLAKRELGLILPGEEKYILIEP